MERIRNIIAESKGHVSPRDTIRHIDVTSEEAMQIVADVEARHRRKRARMDGLDIALIEREAERETARRQVPRNWGSISLYRTPRRFRL